MKLVALISGGTEGLGAELAKILAADYEVWTLARGEKADLKADVSNYARVEAVVSKLERIDLLINNAGIWIEGLLENNEPEEIKRVLEVNTLGTIYLTRAVLPIMKKQKSGKIVNIVSQAGLHAKPERSVYYASKWAITGFTKCLQMENSEVLITGVYPEKMRTNLFSNAGVQKDLSDALEPKLVAKKIRDLINSPKEIFLRGLEIKN